MWKMPRMLDKTYLRLELDGCGDEISGLVQRPGGEPIAFDSWDELYDVIAGMRQRSTRFTRTTAVLGAS